MSNINEIHNVIIMDNRNINNYFKMIDAIRPKEATKCYISVYKFEATVRLPAVNVGPVAVSDNICIFVEGVENTYINDPYSNHIVRGGLLDSYLSSNIKTATIVVSGAETPTAFALYNVINSNDNWVKINPSNLNNLVMKFRTASTLDFNNAIKYTDIAAQVQFFLHLKIKFE